MCKTIAAKKAADAVLRNAGSRFRAHVESEVSVGSKVNASHLMGTGIRLELGEETI